MADAHASHFAYAGHLAACAGYEYRNRAYLRFEWCLLPLATDGKQVDRFFEIEAYPEDARPGEGVPGFLGKPKLERAGS